jgi:phage terminase large subunit-like protein
MPADTIEERADRDRMQYRRWVEEGWPEATPGNVVDHAEIRSAILQDAQRFRSSRWPTTRGMPPSSGSS